MMHLNSILFFILIFLTSLCLTYIYKIWAFKRSLLDIPNERSSHKSPVPRGSGIVIVIIFYVILFYLFLRGELDKVIFLAMIPGIGIATIGLIDDFKHLSPSFRIICQFILSAIALYFLGGFDGFYFGDLKWVWNFMALIGFVWFINLFNFLDGSDGYASMEAISVSLVLWYFTRMDILIVLAASVLGFLYWNWPKAKVFMGDVGSTSIAFILLVIAIYLHNNHKLDFSYMLIITSLFWFDATITVFRRFTNKEKLSEAHKKHMYQRVIQGGFSHLKTLISGFTINVLLFVACVLVWKNIISKVTCYILVLLFFYGIMKYIDQKYAFHRGKNNIKI